MGAGELPGLPGLLVGVDGVLAQTMPALLDASRWATSNRVQLRVGDILDRDWTRCVDRRGHRLTPQEWSRMLDWFHIGRYAPLDDAPPIPGAVEAVRRLAARFSIKIATVRDEFAWVETARWLRRNLGGSSLREFHCVPPGEKHLIGGVIAAVEDDYSQAVTLARAGVPTCLLSRPYNNERADRPRVPGVSWCADWDEVEMDLVRIRERWEREVCAEMSRPAVIDEEACRAAASRNATHEATAGAAIVPGCEPFVIDVGPATVIEEAD